MDFLPPPDPLHHSVIRDQSVAGVALFRFAWTTPESRNTVIWEATILKFLSDEETNCVRFH